MKSFSLIFSLIGLILGESAVIYHSGEPDVIADEWVVEFKSGTTKNHVDEHIAAVIQIRSRNNEVPVDTIDNRYSMDDYHGYSIRCREHSEEMAYIEADTQVELIDENAQVKIFDHHRRESREYECESQSCNVDWGLDRIDSVQHHLDGKYKYLKGAQGKGIDVYVIDTGIFTSHDEFEGRAAWGTDVMDDPSPETDGHGHGTHVAGIIGSKTYGVAKKVKMIAVKVLGTNGFGSIAGVIAGINWVNSVANKKKTVVNLSLGSSRHPALNDAINELSKNAFVVAAAGNEDTDACGKSPASAIGAFTVMCSNILDKRCSFSNYGNCSDIVAPGRSIKSTWIPEKDSVNVISGTSMSAPFVAGVAADLLSNGVEFDDLKETMIEMSSKDKISDLPQGSPNRLLLTGCDAGDRHDIDSINFKRL